MYAQQQIHESQVQNLVADLAARGTITAAQQQSYVYGSDTGAANAYAVTLSPAPSLVAGSLVVLKIANANTGASTLAVNGGSATTIKKQGSSALSSGDLSAGQIAFFVYDGTSWQWVGSSGSGGGISGLTTNVIPKATSSTTIGNSSISDNGTTITTSEPLNGCKFNAFGSNNTNICGALPNTASGHDLTAVGLGAMGAWTSGTVSVAVGQSALSLNTTGLRLTAIGSGALANFNAGVSSQTAVGAGAFFAATTAGNDNVAIGDTALGTATSVGTGNVAVGDNALAAETSNNNTAVGTNALAVASGQPNNVAVGMDALLAQTSGFDNVCVGTLCQQQNTSGFLNTAIGHQAGYGAGLTTLNNSVFIGYLATSTTNALTDMIVIGANAQGTASNQVTIGDTGITATRLRGLVSEPAVMSTGTKFTTSGCSISSTTGGSSAGIFTLGANTCTAVITTGFTATTGWTCDAHDRTAPTILIGGESSSTTTTASITIPAGAGTTDVISFSCVAY